MRLQYLKKKMKQNSQDEATYQQQSNNRKKTKKAALNFAEEKLQTKEMHHKINGSVTELQKELLKSNKKRTEDRSDRVCVLQNAETSHE